MKLFLRNPNNTYDEVDILDKSDLSLTKIVKDFDNIMDVKSYFSTSVFIKYTPNNLRVFGYYTNITTTDISDALNGIDSVVTTDSGDFITNGKITIKTIDKLNENYVIELFFTSYDAGFFNDLSKDTFEIPSLDIPNDYATKLQHQQWTGDDFSGQSFVYGLTDNGFNFDNNDVSQGYSLNNGFFSHDILKLRESTLTNGKTYSYKAPFQYGYSAMPSETLPLIRYEWLFDELHSKYGYTYSGNIFSDPKFYNLAISPVFNELESEDTLDDITWSATLDTNTQNDLFLFCDTPSNTFFQNNVGFVSYSVEPGRIYEAQDTTENDYTSLYGTDVDTDVYQIKWLKNFKTSVKVIFAASITHNIFDSGYIRLIVSDNYYTPKSPNTATNPGDVVMNPFSFHLVEDIDISGPSGTVLLEKEFEIDEVHFQEMFDDSQYVIKVELQEDLGGLSSNIQIDMNLRYTFGDIIYEREMNNSYNLNSGATLSFTEQDFMRDFITKFNIIPQVSVEDKKITYYTFDEFYLHDTTELDWNQKLIKDKKLSINYAMSDVKSLYTFENLCDAKNDDMDDDYGTLTIESEHNNTSTYTIENKLGNMFYTDNRGVLNSPSVNKPGFPIIMRSASHILSQYIDFSDNSLLSDKRAKWNENSNISNSVLGYYKRVKGDTSYINGVEYDGVITYNEDKMIDINILRGDSASTGTAPTIIYPQFLGPLNLIDSSLYQAKSNRIYNTLTYDDISYGSSLYSFYETEMNNLINKNTHILEAYFILTESEYKDITMREKIIIDDNRYIIKKIDKYKKGLPVKITLLSWENSSSGWRTLYSGAGNSINMYNPSVLHYIEINERYIKIFDNSYLAFATDFHVPGKQYKITINVTVEDNDLYVQDVRRDGYTGNPDSISQVIPSGSTGTITKTYTRADNSTITRSASVMDSFRVGLSTGTTPSKVYVNSVKLEEFN